MPNFFFLFKYLSEATVSRIQERIFGVRKLVSRLCPNLKLKSNSQGLFLARLLGAFAVGAYITNKKAEITLAPHVTIIETYRTIPRPLPISAVGPTHLYWHTKHFSFPAQVAS